MKVSKELDQVFSRAAKEVASWERWQRSLDPQAKSVCDKRNDQCNEHTEEDDSSKNEPEKLRRSA